MMLSNTVLGINRVRPARSLAWTPQADARLGRLLSDGASIRALSKAFGIGRQAAQQRALKLGLIKLETRTASPRATDQKSSNQSADLGRDALPAGHPITWNLVVQGTCLEGTPYSTPDTARLRRQAPHPGDFA